MTKSFGSRHELSALIMRAHAHAGLGQAQHAADTWRAVLDIDPENFVALKELTIARHRMPIVFEYESLFEDELHLSFQEYVDFVLGAGYSFAKVLPGQNYLVLPR